jgi:hypothetical protein
MASTFASSALMADALVVDSMQSSIMSSVATRWPLISEEHEKPSSETSHRKRCPS